MAREEAQERDGMLIAGWVHLSREECVSQEEMRQGGESRLKH